MSGSMSYHSDNNNLKTSCDESSGFDIILNLIKAKESALGTRETFSQPTSDTFINVLK